MEQLFDCNAYLGHWPFRKLRHNTATGLLKLMDSAEIDKAIVSSIDSIFYKNCQPGNIDLFMQIKKHRDRLIPFAVINPHYSGWEDDLKECVEKFKIEGIALYPSVHGYSLNDVCADELLRQAEQLELPIALSLRIVDTRQGHWLFQVPNISSAEVAQVAKKYPNISFIIRDADADDIGNKLIKFANCYFDISRIDISTEYSLVTKSNIDKFIFGTQIPFKEPMPVILKIKLNKLTEEMGNKIRKQNLESLIF